MDRQLRPNLLLRNQRVRSGEEEGNGDEAREELDRMRQQTEQMMSSMQSGRQDVGEREYKKVKELSRKLMKQLEKVEKTQREIARKSN